MSTYKTNTYFLKYSLIYLTRIVFQFCTMLCHLFSCSLPPYVKKGKKMRIKVSLPHPAETRRCWMVFHCGTVMLHHQNSQWVKTVCRLRLTQAMHCGWLPNCGNASWKRLFTRLHYGRGGTRILKPKCWDTYNFSVSWMLNQVHKLVMINWDQWA